MSGWTSKFWKMEERKDESMFSCYRDYSRLVRRYYVLYYIVNRKRVNRTDWRGYEKRRCEKKKKNKVEA